MTVIAFAEGDRVRVKADRADGYKQPWRERFKKGRVGTVMGFKEIFGLRATVLFDHNTRATDRDFTINIDIRHLELVE